ncbi:MAG: hypothetical protein GY925_12270 [Actinomycetia bacterium]|nr:hypothetical protein [Actinomycetes bacterium]
MLNGSNEGAERRDWEHPTLVSLTASSETGGGDADWIPESFYSVNGPALYHGSATS